MRDELNMMELADRYLSGSMSADERTAFEARMRDSADLRSLVDDQRALQEGLQRIPLRAAASKAYRGYRFRKWAPGAGGAIVVAALVAGGWWMLGQHNGSERNSDEGTTEVTTSPGMVLSDTAGTQLDPLVMMIDPEKDSTVLTPEGIVLDIPQHAFVDSTGHAITSPVRVTFLEALNGADIMKAGLSTMSGDTLLETGGMFYIDAQANGKKVGIDPSKPLTAMVPAQEAKPGMMLYKGAMKADGVIDWRDPQPLKRSLVPVDITTLNFYPPGYEKKLAELGRDVTNKTFKDSLYYSFMCSAPTDTSITKEYLLALPPDEPEILPMAFAGLGAAFEFSYPSEQVQTDTLVTGTWGKNCGIDPSKVMTIWNARFDKTNIATRAFEERMAAIHGTCANAVLDLYVNNLDKDLSDIDAQVGRSGYPVFDHFASRNDGRVDLPVAAADRLRKVYEHWSRVYADAAQKTQEKFWREQMELEARSNAKQIAHDVSEWRQRDSLFRREYAINLKSVCDQLGIKKDGPAPEPPIAAYVANITNPGWWNVDRAVYQATADRKSMNYTDKQSGKTATLTYRPLTVKVNDASDFAELRVYLMPKELNSYQRMAATSDGFSEKLNDLVHYDLVCLGVKGSQRFAYVQENVNGDNTITVGLNPSDENDLRILLERNGRESGKAMLEEASYLSWLGQDNLRQKKLFSIADIQAQVLPVVFPCYQGEAVTGPAN